MKNRLHESRALRALSGGKQKGLRTSTRRPFAFIPPSRRVTGFVHQRAACVERPCTLRVFSGAAEATAAATPKTRSSRSL